jgi:Spy/CpxP family protein refolding chaperone
MKNLALILLLAAAGPLAAQEHQPPPMHAEQHDMFAQHLFPPEMIMQRQSEIGLRDAQRDQIRSELQKAQSTMNDAQWRIAAESEKMQKLLQEGTVDEARVLAQVDSILAIEREVKRAHIALLVRIRNVLTPEQRNRLSQLRPQR